jgi:hypothetical protein
MAQSEKFSETSGSYKFTYDQWVATRDLYLDWLSVFLANKKDDDRFTWRGFNLWYITLPAKKDVESDNEWFRKIHERLNGYTEPQLAKVMPGYLFLIKFVRLLLFDLVKLFLTNRIAGQVKSSSNSSDILFHSLSSNIQLSNGIAFDRNYKYAPLSDMEFGQKADYLVFLSLGKKDVRHFFRYKKIILEKLLSLGRNVIILNRFLYVNNILSVYAALIRKWMAFRRECKKKEFGQEFFINGIFCGDILISEIDKSFLGEIQWSLVYGVSFEEWMRRQPVNRPISIITYGESLSPVRPVYFFSKKVNPCTRFFSIQHSMNSRNKMALYHRKSEFRSNTEGNIDLNLWPDFYLVQGEQFLKIAADFYPANRMRIIGCLKYDEIATIGDIDGQIRERVFNRIGGDMDKPIMLLAPSVSDTASLVSLFSEKYLNGWRVIFCPHPASDKKAIKSIIMKVSEFVQIEVFEDLITSDIFKVANIVVCGYSVSAYEAVMNNVQAIQYADLNSMPLVDPDPEIPFFYTKKSFWEWFSNNETNLRATGGVKHGSRIVENYFFKTDGKAKIRLWEFVVATKTN